MKKELKTIDSDSGVLNVKRSGSITISLSFAPTEFDASFIDPDPSNGSCDVDSEDSIDIKQTGKKLKIVWEVKNPRVIKWDAKK